MKGRLPLAETRARSEVRGPVPDLWAGDGILGPIAAELEAVEAQLRSVGGADHALLAAVATYGLASGGKRIRPALVLLGVAACGGRADARVVRL